jgi:hypothetical protein
MQPGMYASYQQAAVAAAQAQNYQQLQAAAGYPGAYAHAQYYSPNPGQYPPQQTHTIVMPVSQIGEIG